MAESVTSLVSAIPNITFTTYKIRWAIVIVYAIINASNSFLWNSFSPVTNYYVEFYHTEEFVINIISIIYPLITILLGIQIAYAMGIWGIRLALFYSSMANLMGGLLRALSSLSIVHKSEKLSLSLFIISQIVAATAQPFCLTSTTTMAFDWFPENERTLANTIGSLGNALGILISNSLSPAVVKGSQNIPMFHDIILGILIVEFVLMLIVVRKNRPSTPPSLAAYIMQENRNQISSEHMIFSCQRFKIFLGDLIKPFRVRGFVIIFLIFSLIIGYFTMISALFQQILCTKGYSNEFAGVCGSVIILSGLITAGPAAFIADKTGKLTETIKFSFILATMGCLGFGIMIWLSDQKIGILLFVAWMGGFGFPSYSLSLELAAECTFPLSEVISSSILVIGSQLLTVIIIPLVQLTAPVIKDAKSTCGPQSTPQDYTIPNIVLVICLIVLSIVQLFTLKVSYNRRNLKTVIDLADGSSEEIQYTSVNEIEESSRN